MIHEQRVGKVHDACLSCCAVIEKETILLRVGEAPDIDFPGIVHEGIGLLVLNM